MNSKRRSGNPIQDKQRAIARRWQGIIARTENPRPPMRLTLENFPFPDLIQHVGTERKPLAA